MRSVFLAVAVAALASVHPAAADQGEAGKHVATRDTKLMSAPKDDHTFAMHMAEHHRQGIAMADHVIRHGKSAEVKPIARRIKAQQQKDLAVLERHEPSDDAGHHATKPTQDPDMEREMKRLEGTSGAQADALFLQNMIVHHASALVMAQSALEHLKDPELRSLVLDQRSTQAREIGELQRLREGKRAARRGT